MIRQLCMIRQLFADYGWTWPFWLLISALIAFMSAGAWLTFERIQLLNQLQDIIQNW